MIINDNGKPKYLTSKCLVVITVLDVNEISEFKLLLNEVFIFIYIYIYINNKYIYIFIF